MNSIEQVRQNIFLQLRFLGADETHSLETWQKLRRETIRLVEKTLRGKTANSPTSPQPLNKIPLKAIYSFFSVLAILVSEEFDACLVGLVNNDWQPLIKALEIHNHDSLLPNQTPDQIAYYKAHDIAILLRMNWEHAMTFRHQEMVREMEPWEMKVILQEKGLLPHERQSWELDHESVRDRSRIAFSNINLTIDPFTPENVIVDMVKKIVTARQKEYLLSIKQDWNFELCQGAVTEEFVRDQVVHAQACFDFRNNLPKLKNSRTSKTTFGIWLTALSEVYPMVLKNDNIKTELGKKIFNERDSKAAGDKINSYNKKAKTLINAALAGIPLAAVKV